MDAGDDPVSSDMLLKAFLMLGAIPREVAKAL
jgi:hypothetical protein